MYEKITFAELSCYWRGLETCPVQTELCCVIIKSQACRWELLVVLKADFSFFYTTSGFGLSPVSEHDRSMSELVRDVFIYLVYDCFHGLESLGEKHRKETN